MSSPAQPNILFLMTDQMQARVLEEGHPCQTPNLDRLAGDGVRFRRAYTPNAVCSPARASLMTGLLLNNHGVRYVVHTTDNDQANLRPDKPHWAQTLRSSGYRTGYFGKWHVERSGELERYGWDVYACDEGRRGVEIPGAPRKPSDQTRWSLEYLLDGTPGYPPSRFYGVMDIPPEDRPMGQTVAMAESFIRDGTASDQPWCCFASLTEPHDPFVCGKEAFSRYDVDAIPLPDSLNDTMEGQPNIYRKAQRPFARMTEQQHREASACYFASITEIDEAYGRLIDLAQSQTDRETIIVFTTDHGEYLGAHGLYCKNFGAFEEVFNIPLIMAGGPIARSDLSDARVGLHDLGPTLAALAGGSFDAPPDGRSFASLLTQDAPDESGWQQGFAENEGGRFLYTQRILWEDNWKFVLNGFDFDELYDLEADPGERRNLADDPACEPVLRALLEKMWQRIRATGDHSVFNSAYPILRMEPIGPGIAGGPISG